MTMPEPPPPTPVMVPFDMTPTIQRWKLDDAEMAGTKVVLITIMQPMTTTVLMFAHEDARRLADQLFQKANGLSIVRDMPGEGA